MTPRSPRIHHCTSEPYRFFGREAEVAALDAALAGGAASLVAFVGPGGQGKTAIMQHWLAQVIARTPPLDGVFLWSFYRGKDADLCLRELFGYAEEIGGTPEVSASYCVDRLLPASPRTLGDRARWRRGRAVRIGPVVRPLPSSGAGQAPGRAGVRADAGVVVITSRFPLPELERRRHASVVSLGGLDDASAGELLRSVGVVGSEAELRDAAAACGHHAKAVELLGTYLVRYHGGEAARFPPCRRSPAVEGASDEEQKVARVLAGFQAALPQETQDVLALATAFRDPPGETRLREYLAVRTGPRALAPSWGRDYPPFGERPTGWIAAQIDDLVHLRLLERVGGIGGLVIDAHPLVRRSFEHALGVAGRRQSSQARAGFLRGRPDRRRPATLDEAREDLEMFHAFCEAGLWEEADLAYEALDKPRYRFVAPALERDLLLRFFPEHDWRRHRCGRVPPSPQPGDLPGAAGPVRGGDRRVSRERTRRCAAMR